jgi:hypothetical protein
LGHMPPSFSLYSKHDTLLLHSQLKLIFPEITQG